MGPPLTFNRQAEGVEDVPFPLVEGTLQRLLAAAQVHIVHPAAVQFLEGDLACPVDSFHNPHELIGLIQCHFRIVRLLYIKLKRSGCKVIVFVCFLLTPALKLSLNLLFCSYINT